MSRDGKYYKASKILRADVANVSEHEKYLKQP
jgi:hypothetical protein